MILALAAAISVALIAIGFGAPPWAVAVVTFLTFTGEA